MPTPSNAFQKIDEVSKSREPTWQNKYGEYDLTFLATTLRRELKRLESYEAPTEHRQQEITNARTLLTAAMHVLAREVGYLAVGLDKED